MKEERQLQCNTMGHFSDRKLAQFTCNRGCYTINKYTQSHPHTIPPTHHPTHTPSHLHTIPPTHHPTHTPFHLHTIPVTLALHTTPRSHTHTPTQHSPTHHPTHTQYQLHLHSTPLLDLTPTHLHNTHLHTIPPTHNTSYTCTPHHSLISHPHTYTTLTYTPSHPHSQPSTH